MASNHITAIYQSADGLMWFAMWDRFNGGNGVSHYDGVKFVNLTQKDGLVDNDVRAIHQSPDGVLWFGTNGSGVALYDGISWSSLDTRDGLAGNVVHRFWTETMERFQRRFIEQIVRESNGNRREAARRLKMDASNLLRLMRRLDIR